MVRGSCRELRTANEFDGPRHAAAAAAAVATAAAIAVASTSTATVATECGWRSFGALVSIEFFHITSHERINISATNGFPAAAAL